LGLSSQYGYASAAPTAAQLAQIASTGFTMTMIDRAVQGLAPAYDSSNHVIIASEDFSYNGKRWSMFLGLNASGDTVVVLPDSTNTSGPGGSVGAPGASYTLAGSGSSYHNYQLRYNPTTNSASLFVDGVDRIDGYTGETNFVNPTIGLAWGANSGGQGNFNLAELQTSVASVPEPSSLALIALMGSLAGVVHAKRRLRRC
jgi:hypothetical protein